MRRSGSESSKSVVDDTNRRKWDREEYAERARERELEEDDEGEFGSSRRRSLAMPAGPRAPLQQRDYQVDLTSQLGKTQVVTPIAPLNQQAGYYCNVCQCVVKDSANYLDHINGKKHQRALGMSMRVERSSLQQVQQRFEMLKRKKESQGFSEHDFDMRILKQQEEEEDRKKARKERKKEKKKVQPVHGGDDDDGVAFDGDPELAAMMGFGGFGGSKK